MKEGPNIVRIAALIGDPTRTEVLTALMGGKALTATELADIAGVTKQTISAHLAKLADAKLITVESQGRHRYFQLADDDVAHLLESLMGVAFRTGDVRLRTSPRDPALRKARVCYDHLAGELSVQLYERLIQRGALALEADGIALTIAGQRFFKDHGIDAVALQTRRRAFCRTCLDWSERRHHLAGALGAAILDHSLARRWCKRENDSRVVSFSRAGELAIREMFALTNRP
ncbi:MAG: winged helix-turn-helix domain-containing protein [Betaproteobacteria bacterium]